MWFKAGKSVFIQYLLTHWLTDDHIIGKVILLSVVCSSVQMTNVTPEYVAEIIEKFEVADENKQRGVMGIEGNAAPFSCPFS